MTELDPKFTFETFVVGPANRLASAAARRAADSPGTAYNPLFIYSASGLGKSHILMAVAHHAQKADERLRARYKTLEGFLGELTEAIEGNTRDQMRDRYRNLDILLLDDVQFLAGQPEAQEMLLATLDALTATESQIVLASDRPPADIDGLDARLVSRFSGGLIVDIAPPELETRIAIIRKKVDEAGQTLEPGVAEALARYPFKNIRELGGALNRVLATQDLEERRLEPGDIPALMGDESPTTIEAVSVPQGILDEVVDAVASQVEIKEAAWRREVRSAIEAAEREGYAVARLRPLLDEEGEPTGWEDTLTRFREDVVRLREIDRELDRLDNPWPDAAIALLRDPDRRGEAEAFLDSVRERMRPFPKISPGLDLHGIASEVPRIAHKAAAQLVGPERPQYNPLYVWSAEGDTPLRLVAAAGRSFGLQHPGARMAVTSVAEFSEDFIRALGDGVAGAWRERWWTVDLLLVHGAEMLSETERAQDEFFHLFEALKRRGSRVLMAADRPPAEIENIDERLRSRFEGGLVLEITGGAGEPQAVELTVDAPEVAAPTPESSWDDVRRTAESDEAPEVMVPPLDEISFGERGGLFLDENGQPIPSEVEPDETKTATTAAGMWRPSREQVVWVWPNIKDRLVEELD